jgi:putative ABC transport system permease protein
MTLLHRLASMVRWILRRSQAERDMHDELESFVDMAAADQIRDGATPGDARRRAAVQLGGLEQAKERVRGGRHGAWLDVAARDVRCGLRQVRRNPAFSAIAIATLALGIGGVAAIFSAFDAVLIRPLPYTDADRLVMIWDDMSASAGKFNTKLNSTPAEWIEWRRLNDVFTDLASTQASDVTLSGDGQPEQIQARKVTWTFWSVLDAGPCLYRGARQRGRARRGDQLSAMAAPLRRCSRRHWARDFAR